METLTRIRLLSLLFSYVTVKGLIRVTGSFTTLNIYSPHSYFMGCLRMSLYFDNVFFHKVVKF